MAGTQKGEEQPRVLKLNSKQSVMGLATTTIASTLSTLTLVSLGSLGSFTGVGALWRHGVCRGHWPWYPGTLTGVVSASVPEHFT
jgi:hypothetical protein